MDVERSYLSAEINLDRMHYCSLCDNDADFSIKLQDRETRYFCRECAEIYQSFLKIGFHMVAAVTEPEMGGSGSKNGWKKIIGKDILKGMEN